MLTLLLGLALAAEPFPLPPIDGKPLAITEGQKSFRLPIGFLRVRAFYQTLFKDSKDVRLRTGGTHGRRVLVLASARPNDGWKSATVMERETETVIELTPVIQMTVEPIAGKGPPLELFLSRSPQVQESLKTIDHTESLKAP